MYLAIDIGGTKTLIALFSRKGRVVKRYKFKTAQKYKDFIQELGAALADFKDRSIDSVTVAIPGIVQNNYSVKFGNRDWVDVRLMDFLKRLFSCPIWFENDANLATLYESYRLHGKTVFLTFSTGIGGGIAENNRILSESDKFEPGHWKYRYNNEIKEWEDIAAASAIEKYFQVDKATDLRKMDKMQEIAKRMSLGLFDVIAKYRPKTIIIGGPMGRTFRLYKPYLPVIPGVRFKRPKRPNESVIYGCYLYARQRGRK